MMVAASSSVMLPDRRNRRVAALPATQEIISFAAAVVGVAIGDLIRGEMFSAKSLKSAKRCKSSESRLIEYERGGAASTASASILSEASR